ncbi:hypothetical protein PTSG_02701 [Salpingoeca rosetta]|uniref:PH domain-containing protein n=1 Tax=Salpingoeca rosetta (strain ATCC 50818 / BSB-021) TaxID=946362 RepID=F2U322_SALR5|nr:uncharacterized protein PTSG_02701 [Salpingoeca rosetta]EGD82016.1 hypothetical protein PTSG_02701 [Salpingoeca rosetta]|eukprot:XP_004996199.1 hypothetical protein PTSG_02701 [Salpingoeca rosetta]
MTEAVHKEGYLLKWTNYMKGFQRRYFVLDGRSLAYYRSPSEMAQGCRGSLNLLDAKIETAPGNNLVIQPGGKRTGQVFHLRANSDRERQDWINALQLAKQMASNLRQANRKSGSTRDLRRAVSSLLDEVSQRETRWAKALTSSEKRRNDLEAALESLARDHRRLERSAEIAAEKGLVVDAAELEEETERNEEEEDEFFDAQSDLSTSGKSSRRLSGPPASALVGHAHRGKPFEFRRAIPFKPNKRVSLWGIMKNCIGKDLSKIPMPVNFNEPISFTQRLSEDLEYAHLLDKAAKATSSQQRMVYVAAFTVSSFSSGADRTGKPFNPLLGETFELDRRHTKGWRALLEQVSHHPPIAAFHSESDDWIFWQEFSMDSKFRGKYLEVIPTGVSHLILKKTNDHFTWTKVKTTIHNIIIGKLWLENNGTMDIVNHTTKDVCTLEYMRYSLFSSNELHSVRGEVKDKSGAVSFCLEGKWHSSLSVYSPETPKDKHVIWERTPPIPDFEQMYGFTQMAIESNEISPYERGCAMTDSRFRPDKNLMEVGEWDMANRVKHLLEEGQRFRRREYERTKTKWTPAWFELQPDPVDPNKKRFQYKGGYWEAKEKSRFGDHGIVDVYDIRPVEQKDMDAARAAKGAMVINDHSELADE